ncbi:T9SS type A sorting domain-containing protein [Flavobacterium sp.]|uniref:T9SS type A sorting domain-containing protein n=1 Tax=Flavobacterium sp. TaxID=239 RepID=UPI00286B995C|nr:T9SS type A sorting domain-containing protein [Flavobacterium sp.]
MKKNTSLLLLLIGFFNVAFSQPVINQSSFPSNYSATIYDATNLSLSAGLPGPNQTWDFSSVAMTESDNTSVFPVANVPQANHFPTANFCYKNVSGEFINYSLFSISANGMEYLGAVSDTSISTDYTPNPLSVFTFPYTYNTAFTDTFQSTIETEPNSTTRTYDAYGTLITPYGTYNNAIRQKIESPGGFIYYNWFNANPFQVLAILGYNGQSLTVYGNEVLSTTKHDQNSFSIYPNPTQDDFTIDTGNTTNTEVFVNVYNVLGKVIHSYERHNAAYNKISLLDCSPGLYIIEITDANNVVLQTQKIIKQ